MNTNTEQMAPTPRVDAANLTGEPWSRLDVIRTLARQLERELESSRSFSDSLMANLNEIRIATEYLDEGNEPNTATALAIKAARLVKELRNLLAAERAAREVVQLTADTAMEDARKNLQLWDATVIANQDLQERLKTAEARLAEAMKFLTGTQAMAWCRAQFDTHKEIETFLASTTPPPLLAEVERLREWFKDNYDIERCEFSPQEWQQWRDTYKGKWESAEAHNHLLLEKNREHAQCALANNQLREREIAELKAQLQIAREAAEWAMDKLIDARNVCYGGVEIEEIEKHQAALGQITEKK